MKTRELVLLAALATAFAWKPGRPSDTLLITGDSEVLTLGVPWAVGVCPDSGGIVTDMQFLMHVSATGPGNATMIAHDSTSGATLCSLTTPCASIVGSSVTVTCAAANAVCAPGDLLHLEWDSEACTLAAPSGVGAATIKKL